jgi:hypothetical protein
MTPEKKNLIVRLPDFFKNRSNNIFTDGRFGIVCHSIPKKAQ